MDFSDALKLIKQGATIKRAEDINVSYEEALNIAPPQIKREDTAQRGVDTQSREDSIDI